MEKGKMVKTAKVLNRIFKILQVIYLICAIFCVYVAVDFTVFYCDHPNAMIRADHSPLDIGPLTFAFTERVSLNTDGQMLYLWIMVAEAVVLIAILYYALRVIRKILAPMTKGDPFHPTVGKEIRKLAFASLAIGIIENIVGVSVAYISLHMFNLDTLLLNDQIQSVTANYSFDLSAFVMFFVLLLISYIFRYGEELQKLSDETL